jgi:outer membrane immunogenic protein
MGLQLLAIHPEKINLKLSHPAAPRLSMPEAWHSLIMLRLGMHRFGIIGAGLLSIIGFAGAAAAADLPLRAPAAVAADPVLFSWTGCHVGGNVGAAISEDKTTAPATGASRSFGATGFAGGGQIGCDYQFAPRWVVGVEGRADWSGLKSIHAGQVTFFQGGSAPAQGTVVNNFLASATGRLGYSFADRWLVFARGGAAWTRERIDSAFTNLAGIPVDPSATMTRTGWTAGGGVEWAFAPQWSATLEYNYYDFGRQSDLMTSSTNTVTTLLNDTIHTVTVGVNYHF